MARFSVPGCILLFSLLSTLALRFTFNVFASAVQNHVEETVSDQVEQSTRWAVLVAGSSGYINYRHQADVCHAYQILREGGLKDENIVVFMYDDVAHSSLNPRPGVIINNPMGKDVYKGVPKDYTGKHVTANNLYAAILGDKNAVKGGSGKVVDSKPNDHIFIFYSDHGGPGVLGMPNLPYVYATDFVDALKKKHELNGFKKMVIYVDSCESGSIFEGLLPKNLSIYAITASNAVESSWGTYCPDFKPRPPPEYDTCIGDLFSVAWMEDSENHNLMNESIKDQFKRVKKRTLNTKHHDLGSHVKDYGTKSIRNEMLYSFQGIGHFHLNVSESEFMTTEVVNQRDADLLFKWKMYERVDNQTQKREILKDISETMRHRLQQENNIDFIGKLIFGVSKGPLILSNVRPSGVALTDDWNCLKIMVRTFESHCGSLTEYGMKHMRAFANICNSGISKEAMEEACIGACEGYSFAKWSPESHGYSA